MSKRTEEQQKVVSDMINGSFDSVEFCKLMSRDHRTLQQTFTRLCLQWIVTCASDEYRFDDRNKASHEYALDICNGFIEQTQEPLDDFFLPLI